MPAGGKKYTPRSTLYEQTASKTSGPPLVSTRYQDGSGDSEFTRQITQDEYDKVVNQVYLTEENVNLLETVKLLGEVTNRRSSSGPLAGTGQIKSATIDTSSGDVTAFTPGKGECWQVVGISASANATLGSLTGMTLYAKLSADVVITEWSGAGTIEPPDTSYNTPLIVDENLPLIGRIYKSGGLGTGEEVTISFAMIRIR